MSALVNNFGEIGMGFVSQTKQDIYSFYRVGCHLVWQDSPVPGKAGNKTATCFLPNIWYLTPLEACAWQAEEKHCKFDLGTYSIVVMWFQHTLLWIQASVYKQGNI